ncbi:hypothetical protein [Candidatus Bandiella euplotis]|uniref:Uncharacterized protein n=1 Tax=Candidatus Bandiella euplotis TaxID=1664265 RepID=A0ABZ0UL68_9RICK|nr:hypothetical protein [Candidatus Bandiella woodruffii]WPX96876.1 hypothetical protein Bandiella_01010 [Candidatus Bandiella woodruffii]
MLNYLLPLSIVAINTCYLATISLNIKDKHHTALKTSDALQKALNTIYKEGTIDTFVQWSKLPLEGAELIKSSLGQKHVYKMWNPDGAQVDLLHTLLGVEQKIVEETSDYAKYGVYAVGSAFVGVASVFVTEYTLQDIKNYFWGSNTPESTQEYLGIEGVKADELDF